MRYALTLCLLFGLATIANPSSAQNFETDGQSAEQAGRYREALNLYTEALQGVSEGSAKEQALREKIIAVAQKLKPAPAVPEEAERYFARGRAAVKSASTPKDFEEASNEFARALKIAPWLADAYFNQGVVLDKAGRYAPAIRSLKLYLLAAPNASDAKEAKELIYEIEFRQEKSQKEAVLKREAEERERQRAEEAASPQRLAGRWQWKKAGLPVQITVSGNTISARPRHIGGYVGFTATVNGNTLTGEAYYDWTNFEGGRLFTYPLTGTISSDGNTIQTTHTGITITGAHGLRVDGWDNYQDENIYVRER